MIKIKNLNFAKLLFTKQNVIKVTKRSPNEIVFLLFKTFINLFLNLMLIHSAMVTNHTTSNKILKNLHIQSCENVVS